MTQADDDAEFVQEQSKQRTGLASLLPVKNVNKLEADRTVDHER